MSHSYVIVSEHRLVVSRARGALTEDALRHHYDVLGTDPWFDPTYRQLIDLREVTAFAFGARALQRAVGRSVFSPGARRAVVAATPAQVRVARLFWMLAEAAGHVVRVFEDVAAARAWLGPSPARVRG